MDDRELKNKKNKKGNKKRIYIIVLVILLFLAAVTGTFAFRQHTAAREALEKQEQQQKTDKLEKKKKAAAKKAAAKKAAADKAAADKAAADKAAADKAAADKAAADKAAADKAAADKAAADKAATDKAATKVVTGGHIVCIDPGHQSRGDSTMEPNGPGSSTKKARVTGGTRGTTTGIYEYQLNLSVAEKLKDELNRRGYTVYMTRESNDVNISNKERAEYSTSVGAEITVRIHANGANSSSTNGAMTLVPSKNNPYVSGLAAASYNLGKSILDAYCQAAGFKNLGVQSNDTMTGTNFCTAPVTILEMGFMTNPSDDSNMNSDACQSKMVNGIANGIDNYFGE
jgi:N-acetylmuramoyl-L-alanine amidase